MSTPLPTPTCPACGSIDCRRSRWRSHEEHKSHPGLHPWRCRSCDKRFIGPDDAAGPGRKWPLVVGILSLLSLLAIGIATVSMLDRDDPSQAGSRSRPRPTPPYPPTRSTPSSAPLAPHCSTRRADARSPRTR